VARPVAPGEKIDLDRASAFEIARLPGIGAGLASRIVSYRDSVGGFGSLAAFDAVPGVGPALLGRVGPSVVFSARPRRRAVANRDRRISLNHSNAAELTRLPGIGPAKAEAIIRTRSERGPFRTIDDLTAVPGIGPATVNRLRDRARIP
jgi:competence protein ComEA